MKTLEACYELDFSKINFQERKVRITHPKTILIGPPKCGKSYLIFDYLSNFKPSEYIYIDLNDYRNNKEEVIVDCENFIKQKNIKVLVIEAYEFDFKLPSCDNIILSTSKNNSLTGFKKLYIHALDFEEYLLHEGKNQNITNSFNIFLKHGNLPGLIGFEENNKINRIQEIIKLYCKDKTDLEILKLLFLNVDEKKSVYQLFTTLKKKIKISKDKFYETCKTYEENKLIFFIQKYQQPKSIKKLFSYNHSFVNAMSHTKKFRNEFTNMVFLELNHKFEEIYYLDNVDFYIPSKKSIVLSIPFFNDLLLNSITKKLLNVILEYKIKEITIVTIGNAKSFYLDNTEVQVVPFYEWAVG